MAAQQFFFFFLFVVGSLALVQSYENEIGFGSASHVLIIGIDGLSSSYFNSSSSHPNLDTLITSGASSFTSRDSLPTQSKPNWAAVLAGAGPEETGVDSDEWINLKTCENYKVTNTKCLECLACSLVVPAAQRIFENDPSLYNETLSVIDSVLHDICNELKFPLKTTCNTVVNLFADELITGLLLGQSGTQICQEVQLCRNQLDPLNGHGALFPTLFKVAKYANPLLQTVCYTDNDIVVNLLEKRLIDDFAYYEADSGGLTSELSALVKTSTPEVVFFHINNVEKVGEASGFGSPEYLRAIEIVDYEIGTLLQAYKDAGIYDQTLFLVTSDHGGHGDGTFGFVDIQDVEIPWIVSGPLILSDYTLQGYVRGMDIAASAMFALGIEGNALWQGRPVTEAYTGTISVRDVPVASTSSVVVVDISGLLPTAITGQTPSLEGLKVNGAVTMGARAVMPSTTLSNVASILMGGGPEETGVCSGTVGQACTWSAPPAFTSLPPITGKGALFPSIYEVLNKTSENKMYNTAFLYNNPEIAPLVDPNQVTYIYQNSSDNGLCTKAEEYLASKPNFMFIQFDEVQQAAHSHGYNSSEYFSAVATVDLLLGKIVESIQFHIPDHMLIVLSDHGGIHKTEGETNNECMLVPWLASGPAIRYGYNILEYVSVMDVAVASAYALGEATPTEWIGHPVSSMFS